MKRSLLFYLLVVTTLVQSLSGQILIVHDGADTANFQSFLQSSGYTVDGDVLSDDPVLLEEGYLDSFNLVIYIRRGGSGSGSFPFTIELEESFELYLENGGHLFVTGSRSLSAAGGPRLAQLVRAFRLGSFSTVSPPDLQTSFDSHPILDGLYGNYVGTTFTGQFTQFDSINPDPASPDTVELITVESFDWGQISKFLYTDLPSGAGSVAYWNAGFPSAGGGGGGGGGNDEFSGGAETQNIFLNYLALVIAAEADAGEDLIVAENNGDGVISVILDASGSNSGAGEFISWDWTWPGGSASGERVEVVLPANGTPVEFALEMQNILSETFYDTRTITPYADAALYDDLVDAGNTNFGPTAQVAGDTIVALGGSPNTAVVYRCVAGVWSKEIVPISGADIRIIDENTFITGTLSGVIGNLHVYRWGGASWTESAITVTPSIDSQFVATNWVLHATDTDLILRADAEGTEKVLVYSWNGDSWQYVQELVPDGGFLPGYVGWGVHIGLDDDTLFISRNAIAAPEGEFFEYQIFEKSGATWTQQFRVTMARSSDLASDEFGFGGGLGVVSLNYYDAAINATYPILNAFRFGDGGLELPWYANRNDANPTTYEADINDFRAYRDVGGFSSIHVDSDSDAVVVGAGDDILFFSGNTWNPVPEGAKLRATDLIGLTNHFVADFADGLLLVGDDLGERVRVFDRHTDWALLNVEHAVDAGDPISGISSDGGEIPIYLNAVVDDPDGVATGYTFDWSWSGGGKADRQEDFVRVGPEVEEITLAVIDAQGVLIRDTLSVSIDTAPVIDAGPDHLVVDVDGDGQVNLLVEGALVEADVAITDWNWRWQGGTLTGQSGIVTLGFESHGEDLTLEAYDANGLASEAAFTFELLAMNVSPDILEAVRERDRSRLFYSEHVLLEGDELLLAGVSFSAPSCEEEECLGEGFDRVVPTSFTTSYYAELFRQGTVQTLLLEGSDDVRPILLQQGDVIGVDVSGSLSVFAATEGVNTQTAFASGFTYEGAAVGDGDLVAITGSAGSPPRSVRVYQHNDASWVQLLEIEPPTAADVDFGYRLAMCGDNLVVASEQSDTSHKLHIYSGLSGGGALTMVSVTVSAAVDALVCDAGEILFSHADSATVSNLLLDAATWLPGPGVTPDTPADGFGTSLSLGNDVLVVGDRDDDGAAVLFTRGPSGWGPFGMTVKSNS